jgi:hypothetical protein
LIGTCDYTEAIATAGNTRTYVRFAFIVYATEALVTYTPGVKVTIDHTETISEAIIHTWIRVAIWAMVKVPVVAYTQAFVGCGDYTRTMGAAVGQSTWAIQTSIAIAIGALVTDTQRFGGISNYTGTPIAAGDIFTRILDTFIATANEAWVADTHGLIGDVGHTIAIGTAVFVCTSNSFAVIAKPIVAMVADTHVLIVSGDHTRTVFTAGLSCTR